MFEVERRQAAEGRAFLPDRLGFGRRFLGARQLALDDLAQVILDDFLEITGRLEGMKRGFQRAFGFVVEPFLDKVIKLFLLLERSMSSFSSSSRTDGGAILR